MKKDLELLEKMVLDSLSKQVIRFGFDTARDHGFKKNVECGKAYLHVSTGEYSDYFNFGIDINIRHNALEDLIQKIGKHGSDKFSIGVNLGNLEKSGYTSWPIKKEKDVELYVPEAILLYEKVGVAFVDKYSDAINIYKDLSSNSKDKYILNPLNGERGKRAIGLAYLLNKNDEIDEVAQRYENQMENINDFGLESFRKFVNAIKDLIK